MCPELAVGDARTDCHRQNYILHAEPLIDHYMLIVSAWCHYMHRIILYFGLVAGEA